MPLFFPQELLSLLKNYNGSGSHESSQQLESGSLALTGATIEYLKCHLVTNMYPTVQVLQIIPPILAIDVSWKAVQHITHVLNRSPDSDLNNKLIILLVHTDWPDKYVENIEKIVFPVLAKCRTFNEDVNYWTCWVSNSQNTPQMLQRFLVYLNTKTNYTIFSKEDIFMSATRMVHFFEKEIYQDKNETNQQGVSIQTRSTLYLIGLINSLETIPFCEGILERLQQLDSVFTDNRLGRSLYLELKRMFMLQSRLYFHLPRLDISSFAKTFNVIDFMNSELALDVINYIRIEPILRENQTINLELFGKDSVDSQSTELELYDQFTVIRMFRAVICGSHDSANQIAACKRSFRNIETLSGFSTLLECCVALLFLRWDHLTHEELDQTIESGTESDNQPLRQQQTDVEIESRVKHIKYEKQGFVCNIDNLSLILKTLRQAIAKRRHSDEFPNHSLDDLQRFETVSDVIADSNWRLSLLRKKDAEVSHHTVVDIKKYMLNHHVSSLGKSKSISTDDESDTNTLQVDSSVPVDSDGVVKKPRRRKSDRWSETLPRRKPKKKMPFGKGDSSRQISFSHSTENERRRSIEIGGIRKCPNSSEESDGQEVNVCMWSRRSRSEGRKCFMSKMLGSKEHLMTVCMNQGDSKATRQLIKVSKIILTFKVKSLYIH